jgi:hypothetical protein
VCHGYFSGVFRDQNGSLIASEVPPVIASYLEPTADLGNGGSQLSKGYLLIGWLVGWLVLLLEICLPKAAIK